MKAPEKETVKKMRQHLSSTTKLQNKTRSKKSAHSSNRKFLFEPNANVVGLTTQMRTVDQPSRISQKPRDERHQKNATKKKN